ncbi:hypothetical protein B5S29_g2236 [[Candida] boidinii]|nr:hypothetical protein B5S29_g2236 [[Candida] boidinii]
MSTYADDHNIVSDDTTQMSAGQQQQNRNSAQRGNRRRVPNLTEAISNFLNSESENPATESNQLLNSLRNDQFGDLHHDPGLVSSMLESLLSNPGFEEAFQLGDASGESKGVSEEFLDQLERVDVKKLKADDTCPICTNEFLSDKYPLVVRLPCDHKHCYDLDCIGPWLKMNKTCPMCRSEVTKKKVVIPVDSEEEEEGWDMYG